MLKRISAIVLSFTMCVICAFSSWAASVTYNYIDSVQVSLSYEGFVEGDTDDEGSVTVTVPSGAEYSVDSTAMHVPSGGWSSGDVPNLYVYLVVKNESTTRFSKAAALPDGVNVDGGEAHYGTLKSSGQKLMLEIYLDEVGDNPDSRWEEEHNWNDDSSSGPGANDTTSGAWLQDPNTKRWWYSLSNGTRPVNTWLKINGNWYYFDAAGFRLENQWFKWKEKWYYLNGSGIMLKNTKTPDGYYVNGEGVWDGQGKK